MYFIEEFARLRICLFPSICVLLESSTAVANNGLHEPYLLLTNSSFILILSESHKGCSIWVKFVEIPKQKFASLMLSTRSLFSDKARSFSQSECTLYGNFIAGPREARNPNLDSDQRIASYACAPRL